MVALNSLYEYVNALIKNSGRLDENQIITLRSAAEHVDALALPGDPDPLKRIVVLRYCIDIAHDRFRTAFDHDAKLAADALYELFGRVGALGMNIRGRASRQFTEQEYKEVRGLVKLFLHDLIVNTN